MVTITKHAAHNYEVTCDGPNGCGGKWSGLYSMLTATDVQRVHHHGPSITNEQRRVGRVARLNEVRAQQAAQRVRDREALKARQDAQLAAIRANR